MKTEKVFNRKRELINRDPTYLELKEVFNKIITFNLKTNPLFEFSKSSLHETDPVLREMRKFSLALLWHKSDAHERYPTLNKLMSKSECNPCTKEYDNFIKKHKAKYPDHWRFRILELEIRYKWLVNLGFDFSAREINIVSPHLYENAIYVGNLLSEYAKLYADIKNLPSLKWTPYPNPFKEEPILTDINEFVTDETWIPILINISMLNNHDAKQVKKTIWEIIKSNLPKKTKKTYSLIPELNFLYGIRSEDTFQKYLKWYDYHMGEDYNTPKGFTFRTIAFLEYTKKNSPEQINRVIKYAREKGRRWIGQPIKSEDAVEKAVKLIYQAIHRKPYPAKTKIKDYNCSIHGNLCPKDCENLQKFIKIFDKRYRFKKHTTTSKLDSFAHPKGEQLPAKSLNPFNSRKISGQDNKE